MKVANKSVGESFAKPVIAEAVAGSRVLSPSELSEDLASLAYSCTEAEFSMASRGKAAQHAAREGRGQESPLGGPSSTGLDRCVDLTTLQWGSSTMPATRPGSVARSTASMLNNRSPRGQTQDVLQAALLLPSAAATAELTAPNGATALSSQLGSALAPSALSL